MPSNIFTNDLRLTSPHWREYGSPFSTYARALYPTTLEEVFNWCTPAGTLVDIDLYGRTRPVEEILPGDGVLSADGTLNEVEVAESREVDEDLIVIHTSGITGRRLRITSDHPVLAWRPGNKGKPSELNFEHAESEKTYMAAGLLQEGDWVCRPRPAFETTTRNFPYSPFIVGMYIAEGCLVKRHLSDGWKHSRMVQFTLGSHEVSLVDRLKRELAEHCGKEAKSHISEARPDVSIVKMENPELAVWLQNNIGELSDKKRLPPCVFHLDEASKLELLAAWIDGDGYVAASGRGRSGDNISMDIASVSFELLYQAQVLAQSCGLSPTLSNYDGKIRSEKGFTKTRRETRLKFHLRDMHKLHSLAGKSDLPPAESSSRGNRVYLSSSHLWRKIDKIERERFQGKVYNIRVRDTHNYLVNGFAVHNCEYLVLHHGVYAKAIQRAVRYFITQVEVTGVRDYKIRRKYADYLQDKMGILNVLGQVGDDYMAFGNSFVSMFKPFNRNLICPKCGLYRPAEIVDYSFTGFEFVAKCTKCHVKGPQTVKDLPLSTDDLRIIRWNPRSIEMEYHSLSGEKRFFYEPHAKVKGAINRGDRVVVENTPMEMLDAVKNNQKFLFNRNEIYHMSSGVPASFVDDTAGWGLPPFLANFEQVVQLQMLTRFNEAIMMDYLVPLRLFSPGSRGGEASDPLINIDSGRFMRSIENMVKQHRRDPTSYHSVPYPVAYQALGGEAKQLAPVDMLEYATSSLLSSMGIPQEFYKETLGAGGPPIGLRMFERSWTGFASELNRFLDWVSGKCVEHLMWEDVRVRLVKTSIYEDEEVRQTKLNLLGANKVSNTTAFMAFNIDYEYEVDKILDEQAMFDEKVAEMQKSQQDAQQNMQMMSAPAGAAAGAPAPDGAPAPGGAPAPAGPPSGGGGTLEDMDQQADQQAQQIIAMPSGQRRSQLLNLKKTNDALHALVVSKIQAYENQAGQTGVNMTRQGQIPVGQQGG